MRTRVEEPMGSGKASLVAGRLATGLVFALGALAGRPSSTASQWSASAPADRRFVDVSFEWPTHAEQVAFSGLRFLLGARLTR